MNTLDKNTGRDSNPDPITGAPGAHPVGTGIGAAGAGATGAAIGAAVAGPVGAVVGVVAGAIAGGLAGKGVAETIDPTAHDAYWRDNHSKQSYAGGTSYGDYNGAYRTGYQGFSKYGSDRNYSDVEDSLRSEYEKTEGAASLTWDKAKHATRAAFEHARESVKKV